MKEKKERKRERDLSRCEETLAGYKKEKSKLICIAV